MQSLRSRFGGVSHEGRHNHGYIWVVRHSCNYHGYCGDSPRIAQLWDLFSSAETVMNITRSVVMTRVSKYDVPTVELGVQQC